MDTAWVSLGEERVPADNLWSDVWITQLRSFAVFCGAASHRCAVALKYLLSFRLFSRCIICISSDWRWQELEEE